MNDSPPSVIRDISNYVIETRTRRVSNACRESALKRILDLLAAVGAGISEPAAKAIRATASRYLASGSVPIWFTGDSSSAVGAAWANSAAASVLDLDDGHRLARGHPGAAVIPTTLAVADEVGADMEACLTAITIGYEVGVTIAAARTSYGSTGTWSSYAVVATAAALRHTRAEVLEHALAIAGESAPNQLFMSAPPFSLPTPEGSDIKEGIPWSVVTGLFALEMAEHGFTGPRNGLNSELQYQFANLPSLGTRDYIVSGYYKEYCCCRHIHPPLEAFIRLLDEHSLNPMQIDAIDVEIYSGALRILNKTQPESLIDVQYSIPYCLALVAIAGREALMPLTVEALGRKDVSALAAKVQLTLNPDLDALFPAQTLARVSIVSGGQRYVSDVTEPRGEAGSPLTWDELRQKYLRATRLSATREQQHDVLAAFDRVQSNGDLTELTQSLKLCIDDERRSKRAHSAVRK